jgi:formylglycine-generating enzyme required for sulfatase activity
VLAASLMLFALTAAGASAQTRDLTVEAMRSEKRVALVIGNAGYAVGRLNNPVLDARAMAQTLRGLGFEVLAHENLDYRKMQRAVADFGEKISGGGVGLFYYSGHGLQVSGRNFLVPVDADIKSERYVPSETLDVDSVLAQMQEAKTRVNIVILDACRNNPFAQRFRGGSRGLAAIDAPAGTYMAYATAPGNVADDGDPGKNGVYTAELLRSLREPGLKIEDVFKRVRAGVLDRTGRRQNPWDASSLTGDFFFNLRTAVLAPPPVPKLEIQEEVRKQLGSLALSAKLDGVEVWLGDQRVGETTYGRALIVNNVPEGLHRLRATKAGHKDWQREVRVAANQRAELVIDIEPLRPDRPMAARSDDGADMVVVPAGEFWMGSDDGFPDEKPRHRVHLDGFYIAKYQTTNALYKRFMEATSRPAPGYWTNRDLNGATQPVVGVSWDEADAYCKWAGKRLPTEAEWEKAARGTDGRQYPWGDQWDAGRVSSRAGDPGGKPLPVGSYAKDASPYGVHDMAGNVWEWVADWYAMDYFRRSPERNPQGPESGGTRVMRGGSWGIVDSTVRSGIRLQSQRQPQRFAKFIGFRCARGAP